MRSMGREELGEGWAEDGLDGLLPVADGVVARHGLAELEDRVDPVGLD